MARQQNRPVDDLRQAAKEAGVTGADFVPAFEFISKAPSAELRGKAIEALKGRGPDAKIRLSEAELKKAMERNPINVQPIQNIREAVTVQSPTQKAPRPTTRPKQTVVSQSDVVSGGLDELITRLSNILGPQIENIPAVQASGIPLIQDIAAGQPTPIGTSAVGSGVPATEALQRLLSDLFKGIQQTVPSQTVEQAALQAAGQKFADLAGRTDVAGTKKFAGAGEFAIKGTRYKIDDAGRIIRIG